MASLASMTAANDTLQKSSKSCSLCYSLVERYGGMDRDCFGYFLIAVEKN